MDLIKFVADSFNDLIKPSHNIREVIPGWDDNYPDPVFTDDWELTSEIEVDASDEEEEETIWLTEEEELIAQYGYSNYEFVKDQKWVCDDERTIFR
jgi:hypothetical protein